MKQHKDLLPVIIILGGWFLLNLVQSIFTGLFDDEALFWMYGQRLAWGYYEHPPMVGLLIRMGYTIIHNELGVRLFFIISSTITVFLLMRLAQVRNHFLFAALFFPTIISQTGGFIAAPDVPLILFTSLFFYLYRQYLSDETPLVAVLWGIVMAAMIYSKYNGILIIFFTLLSNLKLLSKRNFYIAAAVAIVCFIPHIIWSFQNDHPTIYYHLIERNYEQFRYFSYFFSYIGGQFGIYGPFLALFLFWFTFSFKTTDLFEKSLKFSGVGILLFFLVYTFRGAVEPNWTVPAFVPMLILTYKSLERKTKLRKIIYGLGIAGAVIILAFRVYMVHDYLKLPRSLVNLSELYYWDEWARDMEKIADGRPVLFLGSYQRASKYTFYTGKTAHSVDGFDGHRTQFYYWHDLEKNLQGREVLVICYTDYMYLPDKHEYMGRNGVKTNWGIAKNFRSNYDVTLETPIAHLRFPAATDVKIPVRIFNPHKDTLRFDYDTAQPSFLVYHIHHKDTFTVYMKPAADISKMKIPNPGADTLITIRTPDIPGRYFFWVSIKTSWMMPGRNQNYQIMDIY